ncbi:hypothetical protein MUO71_06690, partial [Candidatus Bathyarchaeota archaeon]|nr:hypothetical protein [Candidatus Bathyarchaeota archaeon]
GDPFAMGYAVDASWEAPIEPPPLDDPMTDIGPNANSLVPWKIEVTETENKCHKPENKID